MWKKFLGICFVNIKQIPEVAALLPRTALHYLLRAVTLNALLGAGLSASEAPAWRAPARAPAEQSSAQLHLKGKDRF